MPDPIPNPSSTQVAPPLELNVAQERRRAFKNWMIAIVVIAVLALRFPSEAQIVLAGLVMLSILVFVHELGHFQFARWAGMKVNRFGIGFPPWIYTRRYKGIDYSIGALPIGGMVDIAGLGSEEEMVAVGKSATGAGTAATTVENVAQESKAAPARLDSYLSRNPDAPHGERLFQDSKLGWRFLTLFAGPLMNFIFALVVYIGLFSIWGAMDGEKSHQINVIETVRMNTPAEEAGLQAGDKIVAINSVQTDDTNWLAQTIKDSHRKLATAEFVIESPEASASGNIRSLLGEKKIEPLQVTVARGEEILKKTIVPTVQDLPVISSAGIDSIKAAAIGIEFDLFIVRRKVSVVQAAKEGFGNSLMLSYQIVRLLGRGITGQLNKEEKRSIGGPVKIVQEVGKASRDGFYSLSMMAAALSVNLGLMNLLPFPALDGGRILFLGYEFVFRKPVDARKESFVHMVGMVMLLAFMLLITVNDIWPWVSRSLKGVF